LRRGARVELGAIAPGARFGNWLSSVLLAVLYGRRLHDLSPLKAVRRSLYDQLQHRELTYGWTVELLARSLRAGARIEEVEVGYRRRVGGRSKVSGDLRASARAGVRILPTIGRVALPRWTPAARGGAVGLGVALAFLAALAFWIASLETATWRAGIAVWLLAWPALLTGLLCGYGIGMLVGSGRR
jgi:hypothetical protein